MDVDKYAHMLHEVVEAFECRISGKRRSRRHASHDLLMVLSCDFVGRVPTNKRTHKHGHGGSTRHAFNRPVPTSDHEEAADYDEVIPDVIRLEEQPKHLAV